MLCPFVSMYSYSLSRRRGLSIQKVHATYERMLSKTTSPIQAASCELSFSIPNFSYPIARAQTPKPAREEEWLPEIGDAILKRYRSTQYLYEPFEK